MRLVGSIVQIVKWEERDDYVNVPDSDIPHDLIVLSTVDDPPKKTFLGRYLSSFKSKPLKSLRDFTLRETVSIWIPRPHNYRENDLIDLEINISHYD